ncbi:MAG: SWF/SNF helicase family protein, partial [Candidatus Eisenbacteria bacterium]|nr:SWF/SNF helicase family protein [Candidatus Eisenbacteria bacterium]
RQAACHSSLIDPAVAESVGSSKLDLLVEKLGELREEGHKALVFSQFVSLLTFVRGRLDAAGIRYEYLDGKTRNRAKTVERFQNDPELDVFLISLKAGGTGLNLTAATYVFLLDPWWNPAVEAQAIDRAHRIGQERSVLACRIVARDTVEERILELQARKRQLADSIIQEDSALMKNLQREDLEFLLR